MNPFRTLAAALVLLALAVPAHAQAPAGGHATFRIPLTQTFFNPCTGENVTLSGTLVGVLNVRETAAGVYNVMARVNAGGVSGTGESGATYRGGGQASYSGTFTGFPVEVTTRFRLSRQGQGGDARGTAVLGIARATDGTFSATVVSVAADCRSLRGLEESM